MNHVSLIGRLTRDPDMRYTQSQIAVCSFTVAVDRKFKDANGQRQADFIPCVAWRQAAELIGKYFKKGTQIGVTGGILTRTYEDAEGNRKYITEVIVDGITFCGTKQNDQGSAPPEYDNAEDGLPFDI